MGADPIIPSTPSKPSEREATPMDCLVIVRLPSVTVSVNSVPEKSPDPYVTDLIRELGYALFSHGKYAGGLTTLSFV